MALPFSFGRMRVAAISLVALAGVGAAALLRSPDSGLVTMVSPVQGALMALQREAERPPQVQMRNGVARFVDAEVEVDGVTPVARAQDYMRRYGALYGLTPSSTNDLFWRNTRSLADAETAVTFVQHYQNIPVFGGEFRVYLRDEYVYSTMASLYQPTVALDLVPTVSSVQAILLARDLTSAATTSTYADPTLEIYDPSVSDSAMATSSAPHLAWRVFLATRDRREVHLDAHTGTLLASYGTVMEHREPLYDYDLDLEDANGDEATAGNACFYLTSNDDWIGDEDGLVRSYHGDREAVSTWWAARNTYQFFHQTYGLHSYDNDGEELETYVHAGGSVAQGAAQYNGACDVFEFSDGNAAYDLFVHEFTHGIIAESSELIYRNQSGALNESFADGMAAVADGNWTIGETRTGGSQPFRDLANPLRFQQPDTLPLRMITTDNGGVHTNSGVQNKVAYLISEGGTHNGQAVRGIGRAKLGSLMFQALQSVPSTAQYMDARNRIVSLADQWARTHGNGFTPQDACSVRNAFYAAGYRGWDDVAHVDTDCDGREDQQETDRDNDLMMDRQDNCPGVANIDQADADHDGQGDACDIDADNDGVVDSLDNCPNIANSDQGRGYLRNNTQGNACEDADGDGVLNLADNCVLSPNSDQANLDGDDLGDACDRDDDNDRFSDVDSPGYQDNCPRVANPDQRDGDRDGAGDACDNCPFVGNADQHDIDHDGRGDVCDDDRDGDGTLNEQDTCPDAQICVREASDRAGSFQIASLPTAFTERYEVPDAICPTCSRFTHETASSTCEGLTITGAKPADRFWLSDEAGKAVAKFSINGATQVARLHTQGARKYVLNVQAATSKVGPRRTVSLQSTPLVCAESTRAKAERRTIVSAITSLPDEARSVTLTSPARQELREKSVADTQMDPKNEVPDRTKTDPTDTKTAPDTQAPDASTPNEPSITTQDPGVPIIFSDQPPRVEGVTTDPETELFYGLMCGKLPTRLRMQFTAASTNRLTTIGVTYQLRTLDGAEVGAVQRAQLFSYGNDRFGIDISTNPAGSRDLGGADGFLRYRIELIDEAGLRASLERDISLLSCSEVKN